MYSNTLRLAYESDVCISSYNMDIIQAISKGEIENKDMLMTDVYEKLGFSVEEYSEVHNILEEWGNKNKEEQNKTNPKRSRKKDVGTSLGQHIGSLNTSEICITLCNFDCEKAMTMYHSVDFRVVHEAYSLWSKNRMLELSDNFEVAVVAAGGSLDGGKKNRKVVNSSDIKPGEVISFT